MAFLKAKSNKYHVAHLGARRHEVKIGNVNRSRPFDCEIMKGSRKLHHVQSVSNKNPTLGQFQQLFCLCMHCIDCNLESLCAHRDHVLEWTLTRLKPKNPLKVSEMIYESDKEIKASIGGEWIADNLHLGDNITVPTSRAILAYAGAQGCSHYF